MFTECNSGEIEIKADIHLKPPSSVRAISAKSNILIGLAFGVNKFPHRILTNLSPSPPLRFDSIPPANTDSN